MVGVESPAQLPPIFNPAQARKSASSIIISRPISCSNLNKNPNNKFHHFTLTPHYASIFTSVRRQNPNPAPFTAFVSNTSFDSPQPPPDYKPNQEENAPRKVPDVQTLVKRFWKVAAPYWFSDDKIQARWRLATVFALTLGTTGISVTFNFLGRDFYNALANKDQEQFTTQLLYYLAGFAGGIPVFVLRDYAKDTLSLRWRSWMTGYYMDRYLKNRTFYKIQSQSIIDNPDQRIVDDLSSFTGTALAFSLTLFNATVDLISFSNILNGIYPPLFIVLLAYSLGGTAISVFLGRGLVTLNFLQEKKEADFRYGLVRVRENAESIAFYGGEENEMQLLLQRFRSAFENLTKLLISSRNLEFFTDGYRYLIQILPAAVVAPMYFSGKIEFGVINQSVSAFNHILGDFSLIVYQFQAISAFSAVIDRLGEFDDVLSSDTRSDVESMEEIKSEFCSIYSFSPLKSNGSLPLGRSVKLLNIEHLTLLTPSKATLVGDLSFEICEKDHLLVTGPSGSGKTSLLRAIAGLWNFGQGTITFYDKTARGPYPHVSTDMASSEVTSTNENNLDHNRHRERNSSVLFLPQKPYMVLGTLRQQLLYPTWNEDPTCLSDGNKPTVVSYHLVSELSILMAQKKTESRVEVIEKDIEEMKSELQRLPGLEKSVELLSHNVSKILQSMDATQKAVAALTLPKLGVTGPYEGEGSRTGVKLPPMAPSGITSIKGTQERGKWPETSGNARFGEELANTGLDMEGSEWRRIRKLEMPIFNGENPDG